MDSHAVIAVARARACGDSSAPLRVVVHNDRRAVPDPQRARRGRDRRDRLRSEVVVTTGAPAARGSHCASVCRAHTDPPWAIDGWAGVVRIVVGIFGALLVVLMLLEIFLAFLVPQRVRRGPRIVRAARDFGWHPWRWLAHRLPDRAADTMLGLYGPLSLVINLALWLLGMVIGYAALQWAGGSQLSVGQGVHFGQDLYFSAATLVSSGTGSLSAQTPFARIIQVTDAASGLLTLAIVIGYLPALFQAYSKREATVSKLDARAGSPPTAGRLVIRATQRGGWPALNDYLGDWETWTAELMETHLSYPILASYRSQHVNQSWLAALCTVLDSCALTVAAAPAGTVDAARYTLAIARHAVADLSYTFRTEPTPPALDRLPMASLEQLLADLREGGVEVVEEPATVHARLVRMRALYEPYVNALAQRLSLALPEWTAPESPTDNWRTTQWH
jgi:hypothetical protein